MKSYFGNISSREYQDRLIKDNDKYKKEIRYLLNKDNLVIVDSKDEKQPAFRDQVIMNAIPDLLQSLFQKPKFCELSTSEKAEALRQIRFRFSAGVHQSARVCGISYADAASLLDTA